MFSDKWFSKSGGVRGKIHADREGGYTLVEVLITMVILGMILLVVNLVLIAMIRVSYNTDVRIKMRQGVEFAFEVMRRNVKSTDPGTIQGLEASETTPGVGDVLQFDLSGGSGEMVLFYLVEDNDTGNKALKAMWDDGVNPPRQVYLTSPHEINVKRFEVDVIDSPAAGTTEVILTITADSDHKRNSDVPMIQGLIYQTSIIARYRDA